MVVAAVVGVVEAEAVEVVAAVIVVVDVAKLHQDFFVLFIQRK